MIDSIKTKEYASSFSCAEGIAGSGIFVTPSIIALVDAIHDSIYDYGAGHELQGITG